MQNPISGEYLETPARLFERFDTARHLRHLVLDDFPAIDVAWTMNKNGETGGKCAQDELAAQTTCLNRCRQTASGKQTKVVSSARSCRSLIL